MDMHSREQYLETLREEYRRASKKEKGRILSEARKRTRLNRKVLIRKLAHPRPAGTVRRRGASYGAEVVTALAQLWELFDFACGQRLAAALRTEVPRLRAAGELKCSDGIAAKLMQIAPKTIDRLLQHEKQVRSVNRTRSGRVHPLLYQKIPVKVAAVSGVNYYSRSATIIFPYRIASFENATEVLVVVGVCQDLADFSRRQLIGLNAVRQLDDVYEAAWSEFRGYHLGRPPTSDVAVQHQDHSGKPSNQSVALWVVEHGSHQGYYCLDAGLVHFHAVEKSFHNDNRAGPGRCCPMQIE